MSDNSSDNGEVAPPGVAEGCYVTADAYKAALEENALLSSETERPKRHIIELEKAGVAYLTYRRSEERRVGQISCFI